MNRRRTGPARVQAALVACVVTFGCAQEAPEREGEAAGSLVVSADALARVGQRDIDEREFRRYESAKIQRQHRSNKEGVEKYRDHLMTLIDIKLMVLEAEARGLDNSSELAKALELTAHKAMVEAYLRDQVGVNIEITEEELRANFEAHPARHAVRGAHILLSTRAEADSIYGEIAAGRSTFEEMARRHSLDEATAEQGGAFESYYAFDRVSDTVYGQVFSMEIGQVSEPFRTPQGWEIAKVVDKKLVPFEKYRSVIQRVTFMQKLEDLKRAHIAQLVVESNLRPVAANLQRFISAWNANPGSPDLHPDEWEAPLYMYDGGQITVQEGSNLLHNVRLGRVQVDSAAIEDKMRHRGAPDLLLGLAASRAGYADRPEVQEKVRAERERLLLEDLWDELLEIKLEATEEEMRAHYDAHPEMYKIPEEIVIQEIMVADRERAKALLEEIRNGADMADLATQHSLRRFSEENGGLYAMRAFEKLIYKEIMAVALNAPDLELQGPVELQNPMPATMREPQTMAVAYSIFKVLQRLPERVQTFELSREKAQYFARQAKQQSQLRDLNLQLRRKYRDKWGINQEALTAYARALATP